MKYILVGPHPGKGRGVSRMYRDDVSAIEAFLDSRGINGKIGIILAKKDIVGRVVVVDGKKHVLFPSEYRVISKAEATLFILGGG